MKELKELMVGTILIAIATGAAYWLLIVQAKMGG